MKVDVVGSSTEDLSAIDFQDVKNQREDEDLQIGIKARAYLLEIQDECNPAIIKRFYK